ncbi:MAG: acyl-CoA dehydrogenase [Woeseiaceae bacterium]|jgi:alkylation response protein AidB-like acyl-CoA dehydrogenase|nr:acyl-CoA dehydrogenase [Woeseiaceae bacterium]
MSYTTPVRDFRYALKHMAGFDAVAATGAFDDLSDDLVDAILEEMGRFCDEVVAPLNWASDQDGAKLEDRAVTTTPGFADAYRQYVEGGWNALAFPEEAGGQGLPSTLAVVLVDALNAACASLAIGTSLTIGAGKAIKAVGTEEQQAQYLEKLVSGEWTAGMNLTEPQAGSDLADIKMKAEPVGDGRYRITGQKIYITYGDHDMTDNVIHLVLARLPDAPEGTRGISMFIVPKFHVNDDGTPGERNDVYCVGLEHKMGLHGSPTCVMSFGESGECYGTLLGEENKGLRNMFIMMNSARLDVGVQGVGIAERSFQHALGYAQDRRQGRAPGVRSGGQVPIYEHPDVRRMLYTMKSLTEAARGICYANAVAYDLARVSPDETVRASAAALEGLLTPISKAWSTDRANEVTSIGVQVHGGMGYVEETGAAQYMRDCRIAAIYEGTNGIQAIDLVGRKLQGDGGEAARNFMADVGEAAATAAGSDNAIVAKAGQALADACDALRASTDWLLERAAESQEDVLAGATPYLKQFGNVAGGFYLLRGAMSALAADSLGERERDYRLTLLGFYAENFLSEAVGLTPAVTAGASAVAKLDPEVFGRG